MALPSSLPLRQGLPAWPCQPSSRRSGKSGHPESPEHCRRAKRPLTMWRLGRCCPELLAALVYMSTVAQYTLAALVPCLCGGPPRLGTSSRPRPISSNSRPVALCTPTRFTGCQSALRRTALSCSMGRAGSGSSVANTVGAIQGTRTKGEEAARAQRREDSSPPVPDTSLHVLCSSSLNS